MARFRTPANVQLRRAQLTLMLATLLPTILMTALGIVLVAIGGGTGNIVIGVLVLAFCTSSLTGYILGSIFVSRGATVARFQNDFLSAVSHELRTPLTSILLFIETLRDERLTDTAQKQKCLDLLEREIRRLEKLVERLIRLSRMESGRHKFEREHVLVRDVIDDAVSAFHAASIVDPAELTVHMDGEPTTTGDHEALSQAVGNLLINAWKYTPQGNKHIDLRVETDDKHVNIQVVDNGPGIPRAERKQIFNQFERGKSAIDSNKQGSGLGLAIAKAIVVAHNGKIELRSQVGHGCAFRIRLKRSQNASKAA